MSSKTTPTPDTMNRQDKSVPVKLVVLIAGSLVVLAGTFYAGMAYENHRITSAFETAFGGPGGPASENPSDPTTEDAAGADSSDSAPEPVALIQGAPTTVTVEDGGELQVTLVSTKTKKASGTYEGENRTRNLEYELKVENIGDTPATPSFSAHYETQSGEVLGFAGVFCDAPELPSDPLKPGQFATGCSSDDLPDDAGQLVFDEGNSPFYIPVEAA